MTRNTLFALVCLTISTLFIAFPADAKSSRQSFFKEYYFLDEGSDPEERSELPPYFISPNHIKEVDAARLLLEQRRPDSMEAQVLGYDFRGLKLGASYDEVSNFIKREGDGAPCTSWIGNFYSRTHDGQTDDRILQGRISCRSGGFGKRIEGVQNEGEAVFVFSRLGRLYMMNIDFEAEESPGVVFQKMQEKFSGLKWQDNKAGGVLAGYKDFEDMKRGGIEITLKYAHPSPPRNGHYVYAYNIRMESRYIRDLDAQTLNKVFFKAVPAATTRL